MEDKLINIADLFKPLTTDFLTKKLEAVAPAETAGKIALYLATALTIISLIFLAIAGILLIASLIMGIMPAKEPNAAFDEGARKRQKRSKVIRAVVSAIVLGILGSIFPIVINIIVK
ncbi:hypothetical protein JN00_0435 [Metamycoplasma subdolum]|uniref:Transmembrane protein n=1 Tax=Metamycoplasma subdolum TaxID=92407 RepID=A0A3L9ZZN2_9BACT|nr:hypothetical protein [Metamycoplasma subdolum]RMA77584.1 hypothetical protein JN00_0435 [Metamycoplasma subdolum]WPB50378.1 hypothetical protein R9C05_02120 [Metamycoplasma subdolum]